MPDPNENIDDGAGAGDGANAFLDALDPDLKSNPSVSKFKDVKELAKSYVELQKLVGADKIKVPTDKSTPEEWQAYWDKGGRPSDVKDYEVPEIEMPDEIKMRQEHIEAFRAKAHELGLNKKQFKELFSLLGNTQLQSYNQSVESAKKIQSDTETSLRKEWGAAYDAKVDKAQSFINKFFKGEKIHPAFGALSNDQGFVRAMAKAAEAMGEDVIAGGPRATKTPSEAQAEINAMMMDPKHPLNSDLHPEHMAAVDYLLSLRQMVEAGQK